MKELLTKRELGKLAIRGHKQSLGIHSDLMVLGFKSTFMMIIKFSKIALVIDF